MICPHCKKFIPHKQTPANERRALILFKQGYSCRDIERLLFSEGIQMSFATVSRLVKKAKLK